MARWPSAEVDPVAAAALAAHAATDASDDELAAEAARATAAEALKQDASSAATDVELAVEAARAVAAEALKQDAATAATDTELASAVSTLTTAVAARELLANKDARLGYVGRDDRGNHVPDPIGLTAGTSPRTYGVVLGAGTAGQFDENFVAGLSVWWDENVHRWAGVYVGYNTGTFTAGGTALGKIGLAWSDDLLTWTKDAANPILSPSGTLHSAPASGSITAPFMYWEPGGTYGTYYLFALGSDDTGYEKGTKTLLVWSATGTVNGPPTSGWGSPTTVVATGAASWCSNAIWHPNVVKVGSTYHLFVNGTQADTDEVIGHAIATSPLGPWTVDPTPVLTTGAAGQFDESHVADPWVYKAGGYWYMWYAGVNDSLVAKDALAWTTAAEFPTGWRKHRNNPIVSVWSDTTFSNTPGYNGARPGAIINTGAAHYHFYTVGWPERIGLSVQGAAGFETDRGARRRPWQASDNKLSLAAYDPAQAATAVTSTLGFVVLTKIWVPDTVTVANLRVGVQVAGATLTSGQNLGGLYKPDGTLIAKTATQHTAWQSTGAKSMALTAETGQSLTLVGGTDKWVYAAVLANGTTAPQFLAMSNLGATALVNVGLVGDATDGYRSAFKTSGSQTSLPSSLGAVSSFTGPVWMGLS